MSAESIPKHAKVKKPMIQDNERHNQDKSLHKCGVCDKSFAKASTFFKHLENHTKKDAESSEEHAQCYFVCDICEKQYTDVTELLTHVRGHNRDKENENILVKDKKKPSIPLVSKTNSTTSYSCTSCLNVFPTLNSYKNHTYKCWERSQLWKCHICNMFVSSRHSLKKHLRIHTGEKPYRCDICNKAFAQQAILSKHRRVHTKEKPFDCKVCKKAFSQSGSLTRHMRIHNRDKPHECEKCGKAFTRSDAMVSHMKNNH